ncbi:hypothetical protein HK102_005275 [Quaeritorhiza haematococci]|nr:hypothetical protein HK102_005275 [Quaeritorhiza haematococci]
MAVAASSSSSLLVAGLASYYSYGGFKPTLPPPLRSFLGDLVRFMNQGNRLDLAIAIFIGASFSGVINSFAADIITPVFNTIVDSRMGDLYILIQRGKNYPYNTREDAIRDGAVTWNYGKFLQTVLNFLIHTTVLFLVIKTYHWATIHLWIKK